MLFSTLFTYLCMWVCMCEQAAMCVEVRTTFRSLISPSTIGSKDGTQVIGPAASAFIH